jgi:DNA-binding CsgD family transcriptional regulator
MTLKAVLRCAHAPFFRFTMCGSIAILGRSARCEFVVDDSTVSRRHAEITYRESRLRVNDLNSRNGTFVDALRIQMSEVQPGQVVRFGSVPFLVTMEEVPSSLLEEDTGKPRSDVVAATELQFQTHDSLSVAQRKVFQLLMTGCAEKAIARRLNLSQHTVHNHVRAIFRTFAVHSRAELFAVVLHKGNA